MLKDIMLAFIPIFVAVDPIGVLPIFVTLTEGIKEPRKKKIITQSILTALALAFGFIFLGKGVFHLLGITMGDFMVAGGIVLFCIAIIDLVQPGKVRRVPAENLGAVPIGTPLIVGPAVLTTSLLLIDHYGVLPTVIAVVLNVLLVGIIFSFSDKLMGILGQAGARAFSKIVTLLLAAIAVKMIRVGVFTIIGH